MNEEKIIYRYAKKGDEEGIKELCDKHQLSFPNLQLCFVAECEGKIIGLINAMQIPEIGMVCDNMISATRLYDMMLGALSHSGVTLISCVTKRENIKRLVEKLEFKKVEDDIIRYIKEI